MPFLRRAATLVIVALCAAACETQDPTNVVIENAYGEATPNVVYKAWWVTTLFDAPVRAGASSAEERGVPAIDFVYALVAPGWDPASGAPPSTLVALKSKEKLSVKRGDTLRISISDATFAGSCQVNQALSQEDADFITQRIFPGEFANVTYDAKRCSTTPVSDGGVLVDAATEASR